MNRSVRSNDVEPPQALSEVYRDAYMTILAEAPGTLIRLQRTPVPHPTPTDLEQSFRHAATAIDRHGRTGRVMLVDMREALGRNEPEFEASLRRVRPVVEREMLRVAVLLRSTVGMLQMKRINEEDGVQRMLTMHEHEALEFLRTENIFADTSSSNVTTTDGKRR